ncbi:MAG: tetratricopeptide repeat protein [Thermoguttaceae bacterium]
MSSAYWRFGLYIVAAGVAAMALPAAFAQAPGGVDPGVSIGRNAAREAGLVARPDWTSMGRAAAVNPHLSFREAGTGVRYNTAWNGMGAGYRNAPWGVAASWARPNGSGWNRATYYGSTSWWPTRSYYDYGYPFPRDYGYSLPNVGGFAYNVVPFTTDYGAYTVQEQLPEGIVPPREVPVRVTELPAMAATNYDQAVSAFQAGRFDAAVRLAQHAALDDPQNTEIRLLLSLGLFATGQYRAAAAEARTVTMAGPIPDWATVYSLYGDVGPYTDQLRALEKYVRENSASPEGRFILGFQYMLTGHRDEANPQFLLALEASPQDRLAAELLTRVGGQVPPDIARRLAMMPQTSGRQLNTAMAVPAAPAPQR